MVRHPQVVALYADILGFKRLIRSHEHVPADWSEFPRSVSSLELLREHLNNDYYTELTRTLTVFHVTLDYLLNQAVTDPLQCISFSDSALIAFPSEDDSVALLFAESWMRELLSFEVPVRMGVGTGSFRALRLMTDVSDDLRKHSSQYMGTAVIQAHEAESCGLKGMRIFVHPEARVSEQWAGHLCPVQERVPLPRPYMSAKVERELNYTSPECISKPNCDLVRIVTGMRDRVGPADLAHYDDTLYALAQMREARGETSSSRS